AAVIDAQDHAFAVFQVSHAHDGGHGKRRMRSGQVVLVEYLAIGGVFAMEARTVPRSGAGTVISAVIFGIIGDAVDDVGFSDLHALWDGTRRLAGAGQSHDT